MSEEFAVNDRRLFNKDGQINAESPAAEGEDISGGPAPAGESPPAEDSRPTEDSQAEASANPEPPPRAAPHALPPASFPSLLVGLATSALINLGENQEPGQAPPRVDLSAAKQAIDFLGVLQAKTQGNLESEEEALLETLLYDLRLKYVKASR